MDTIWKFGINNFFPTQMRMIIYKTHNFFLREAITAVIFAEPRVKFNPPLNNPAQEFSKRSPGKRIYFSRTQPQILSWQKQKNTK